MIHRQRTVPLAIARSLVILAASGSTHYDLSPAFYMQYDIVIQSVELTEVFFLWRDIEPSRQWWRELTLFGSGPIQIPIEWPIMMRNAFTAYWIAQHKCMRPGDCKHHIVGDSNWKCAPRSCVGAETTSDPLSGVAPPGS